MSKQFIRLLAAAAFALLIQANFLPANAAPNSGYEKSRNNKGRQPTYPQNFAVWSLRLFY